MNKLLKYYFLKVHIQYTLYNIHVYHNKTENIFRFFKYQGRRAGKKGYKHEIQINLILE